MVKYIKCWKCNQNGETANACHCDELSESPETPCYVSRSVVDGFILKLRSYYEETQASDMNTAIRGIAMRDCADMLEKLIGT